MRTLTTRTLLAYCFFRTPLSPIDFTLRMSARTSIWLDMLKMSASMQAMLVAGVKSFDFLLGFIVGKWSDNVRSRFGRRRPFIKYSFPLAMTFFLAFCNAGYLFGASASDDPIPCSEHLVNRTNAHATGCRALKGCIDAAIRTGHLQPPNSTASLAAPSMQTPGSLALCFVLLYFGFVFCCWTATQIPYDALGMELTDDYEERSFLFGVKVFFQFVGYVLSPLAGIALSAISNDLLLITSLRSIIFATLGLAAQVLLLVHVKERPLPTQPASKPTRVPLIPSARRALNNSPYRRYLLLKIPLSIFSFVPSNMVAFYIKYSMALEAWTLVESVVLVIALIGGMLCSAHPP